MAEPYDIIVIGGGHNGLVNAAYLAKAGKKVLVLEQRHLVGGATVTEELYPGFNYSVMSYVVSLLRPEVIRELKLAEHGLRILPLESTLSPLPGGEYLYRDGDHYQTLRNIARFSPRDAEAYEDYSRQMFFMAKAVKYLLGIVPPDPLANRFRDLSGLLKLAQHVMGLSRQDFFLLSKLMTMSAADFVERWFESEPLKATLSASGIIGTFMGPRSPGTAYVLLHHYMGEIDGQYRAWGFARGGTGAIADALASSAKSLGVDIRLGSRVTEVIVEKGQATGVVLEQGQEIRSSAVVSSLDPLLTFLRLVDERWLPEELVTNIRKFNIRGSSAKVNLSLDRAPELACWPGTGRHLAGAISISPSIEYLEKAYDEAKYGSFSRSPYLDIIIPSMIDPGMAPPGKHVMSCFVQYAPYQLQEGSWQEKREELGNAVVDTLSTYFPGIQDLILHRQVVTPEDIEEMTGLSQGNIFQGELSLSQLFFMRPAPGYAQYRTPIKHYYQCGSATHPGGGISGAPGRLAAMEILRDGL